MKQVTKARIIQAIRDGLKKALAFSEDLYTQARCHTVLLGQTPANKRYNHWRSLSSGFAPTQRLRPVSASFWSAAWSVSSSPWLLPDQL